MKTRLALLALFTASMLTLGGCAKEEGPMEKMGKSVDEAAEKAEKAAEDISDDLKDAVSD